MKITGRVSDRIRLSRSSRNRWYGVRPALGVTLALAVVAWLGLLVQQETRVFVIQHQLAALAQWARLNASTLVVVLAILSVVAVLAEVIRSSRRLRRFRSKIVRSMKITQHLLGSRTS